MRTLVGTSGYNYPEWKGTFYPDKLPAGKMLAYYATQLPVVEINYTFYRTPSAKTVAVWAETTPPEFMFVLKAPKRITHDSRLKFVDKPLAFFCETAASLGPKLGPLLFQLPPNFKKDIDRLRYFLPLIPAGRALRVRVPPPVVVLGRRVRATARPQRRAVHRRH